MSDNAEQCVSCKWYLGAMGLNDALRCLAFSKEIPREILTGEQQHQTPYKGDGGIVWEEGTRAFLDDDSREHRVREITEYLEELKELEANPPCPRCGTHTHEIIYGMPAGPPTFRYFAAGCIIDEDSFHYRWWCRKCNTVIHDDSIMISRLAYRYSAFESIDKREFQRSARILQSIWRTERGYDIGELKSKNGSRPLGSRLPMPWARESLGNYLNETIRNVVRDEVIDPIKSKGRLFSKPRISEVWAFEFGNQDYEKASASFPMDCLNEEQTEIVTHQAWWRFHAKFYTSDGPPEKGLLVFEDKDGSDAFCEWMDRAHSDLLHQTLDDDSE